MKWTKFKSDFDPGGSLHRLLKPGDKLIKDPGTPVQPAKKNIWISEMHDPLIDNCFRIYTDYASLDKEMWDGKDPDARESSYHPWLYYENVPQEYSDPVYFNPIVTEKVAAESSKQAGAYEKDAKSRGSQAKDAKSLASSSSKSGGKYPAINPKYIPHPYEIFAGGWVHFYDHEVRHDETDHAIYFEWDHTKMNVTVHIFQTKPILNWNVYVKVNPPATQDPPPPKSPPPYC